jgi:hypothetical protein
MKNLRSFPLSIWALLVAIPLVTGSCRDDNPATATPATVEGNYKITALSVDPKALGLYSDLIAASKLLFSNTTCLTDLTITFKAGGDATTDNPTSCQTIPVPLSTFTGVDASSKWVYSGNKLTITKSDGTKTDYTVLSTGTVLKLQWQGALNYPIPNTTVYTYTMDLTKK